MSPIAGMGHDAEMLDGTHRLMMRGVQKGIPDGKPPAPALTNLIAVGFVSRSDDDTYSLTQAGRAASRIDGT